MIRVLGRPPGDPAVLRQTGSMGETAFYPFLSGRDNLRAVARRRGIGDRRVDMMLGQAGLAERVDDVAVTDGALALALAEVTPARAAAVNRELVGAGLAVSEVRTVRRALREVFLDLTGRRTGGADSLRPRAGRRGTGRKD